MAKQKSTKEKATLPIGRSKSPDLASNISQLRKNLSHMTQEMLGERLGVTRSQISSWEAGREHPSAEKLIALGHLSQGWQRLWFWEQAGLKVAEIEEEIRAKMIAARRETALVETVRVARVDSTALLCEIRDGKSSEGNAVSFPSLFIPNPEWTRCIQVSAPFAGAGLSVGDVALVQLLRESLFSLLGHTVAVFYERLSPERLLTPEAVRLLPPARQFSEVDRRDNELNRSRDPLIRAETDRKNNQLAERLMQEATASGVLFGNLNIEHDERFEGLESGHPAARKLPWRVVLNCGNFWRALTQWNTKDDPSESTFSISSESGIHVLGTMIGWLRRPAADVRK